jgi:octaprenyl-diphosphate synthase
VAFVAQRDAARETAQRPGLERLRTLVAADLAAVNAEILRRLDSRVSLIPQLARHLIAAGGKRIRPMLTLGCAKLCGYGGQHHVLLAACVEFIHTATLLHDDVVDESDRRRGNATANAVWGNQPSVLVGDFLFTRAFQLMVEARSLEVLATLANASAVIAEGEVLQLQATGDTNTSEAQYFDIISAKTAALFAAACRVAGVLASRPAREIEALDVFGRELGIAFQLVDDALDYSAEQASLGKNIGDDFKEGKVTLPVLLAYQRGDETERAFWRRTIARGEQQPGDLNAAIQLTTRHQALAETVTRARAHGERARAALAVFADSEIKDALLETVAFAVERGY